MAETLAEFEARHAVAFAAVEHRVANARSISTKAIREGMQREGADPARHHIVSVRQSDLDALRFGIARTLQAAFVANEIALKQIAVLQARVAELEAAVPKPRHRAKALSRPIDEAA